MKRRAGGEDWCGRRGVCVCVCCHKHGHVSHTHTHSCWRWRMGTSLVYFSCRSFLPLFPSSPDLPLRSTLTTRSPGTARRRRLKARLPFLKKSPEYWLMGILHYYPLTLANYSQLCLCGETFFSPSNLFSNRSGEGWQKGQGRGGYCGEVRTHPNCLYIECFFVFFCWPYVESAAQWSVVSPGALCEELS